MKLINAIEISRFRSIQHMSLTNIGDLTALAGLNNSGKSNVLRALHVFFTNEVEPGLAIDVDRDFYRPELKHKKKKQIRVRISFQLPKQLKFRKGLERVEELLGREFSITKEWDREHAEYPIYYLDDNEQALGLEDARTVAQFLALVSFRYIPNRVLPTEVIREEQGALRDALVRRLGGKAKEQAKVFGELRETSVKLIDGIATHFRSIVSDVDSIRLKTPETWAEILFALGYELIVDDVEIDDLLQGSGIQSLLMFETLSLIDRDYFQQFGWRQAAIWAVEEPESSLHTSLEAQIAAYLRQIASEDGGRLQVMATTHSDLMLQYADQVGFLERTAAKSVLRVLSDSRKSIELSANAGISRWVHPLLYYPLEPLVFVEGKYDVDFLRAACRLLRPTKDVRVVCMETLDAEPGSGGVDRMKKYLRAHRDSVAARSSRAPLIVILDWDAANQESSFKALFAEGQPVHIMSWPSAALNPKLGGSFHGIERAFSDRLIEDAIKRGADIGERPNGIKMVESEKYGGVKKILNRVVQEGISRDDLKHCEGFVGEMLKLANPK